LDKTALVLCDARGVGTDALLPEAPRSLLGAQVERASEAGFSARAGSEVEYYIFSESYRKAHRRGYSKLRPAADYIEDYHLLQGTREETLNAAARHHLCRSGVPVECTKGEWGRGQHELNLRFTEVLEMADRHAIYKHALKEIADALGISVTFMAKWSTDHAGSSCHLHVSLWRDDRNVFASPGDSSRGSDYFRWFLGGWMKRLPELMAFYAPTVNSYKRFQAGSWAPTRITWAVDNRTAGFRVVGRDQSLRIECRVPGADCNPYLTFAAALASGLHGIEQRIEPPEMFEGNAYEADPGCQVPGTLRDAIERLQQSDFARRAFGEQVVHHYVHFFRTELAAYDRAVTDWERFRYFERI
jgi:glutamine synthetase